MMTRYLLALVGAVGVTVGLLYGMSGISAVFTERDPTRYFQITDVILNPGRGRPQRIPESRAAPERENLDYQRGADPSIDVTPPAAELPDVLRSRDLRPLLEDRATDADQSRSTE